MMEGIVDWRKDDAAIPIEDKYITTKSGQKEAKNYDSGMATNGIMGKRVKVLGSFEGFKGVPPN